MNIAIVTTWFPSGAGYVSKAYRETLENGNSVYIYARGGENMSSDSIWDDSFVTWAPVSVYNEIRTNHFLKWLKTKRIDIVLFNEQHYWEPVVRARKAGFFIGTYIDYYTEETVPLFEIYDFLICNTKRHLSVFNWHPNCLYVPWGTNIHKFKTQRKPEESSLSFIISLGWEGNYTGDRKGLLFVINAFKQVQGDCTLKIFSQLPLEKCRLEWRELIDNDRRIDFIEGTYDPFPFNKGDIYVYPSRLDGIGLSLPEAISSGLACITTDNAPMNEFVTDFYNGRLVKVSRLISRQDGYYWPQSIVSIESLKEIMQWYVFNKEKAIEHGINSRKYSEINLDWSVNSKGLISDLNNIYVNREMKDIDSRLILKSSWYDRSHYPTFFYRISTLIRDIIADYLGFHIALGHWFKGLK